MSYSIKKERKCVLTRTYEPSGSLVFSNLRTSDDINPSTLCYFAKEIFAENYETFHFAIKSDSELYKQHKLSKPSPEKCEKLYYCHRNDGAPPVQSSIARLGDWPQFGLIVFGLVKSHYVV